VPTTRREWLGVLAGVSAAGCVTTGDGRDSGTSPREGPVQLAYGEAYETDASLEVSIQKFVPDHERDYDKAWVWVRNTSESSKEPPEVREFVVLVDDQQYQPKDVRTYEASDISPGNTVTGWIAWEIEADISVDGVTVVWIPPGQKPEVQWAAPENITGTA
jgi:hypothetical protein